MAEKISPAAEDRGATQTISFGLNGFVENTQLNDATQESIRAQIINSGEASAKGVTARGPSPVLALCRKLVEAGFDPGRPLHAYRDDMLALRVRSIGEGARLTVKTAGNGAPVFARECTQGGATAPPVRLPAEAAPTRAEGTP